MKLGGRLALMAALLASGAPAGAQSYFGQNQVQYETFHWRVKETEHFLVHYYPEEEEAAVDAARMAERSYTRLSKVLGHEFREKKPIILYSSRPDFAQNNVTGDLGEGTGGVTEATRHRMLLYFTGDYRSFEHVLTHEMVHAFQYDIFAHGKAGGGLRALAEFNPPLWFAEGMAEYLSLGPDDVLTNEWMSDAALNGPLPTIADLTAQPDRFFPYRFGDSFWEYIGRTFGDDAIGQVMNAVPTVGVDRAFNRELGQSLEDLGEDWRRDLQKRFLPQIATRAWPKSFAAPVLDESRTGGTLFLAPSISPDGETIAFLSDGEGDKGDVFIDLWLADGTSGHRTVRLAQGMTPDFEEFRVLSSQSAFSPDGRSLAFTAQTGGRDVLYLADIASRRIHRVPLDVRSVTSPSWSPDGRRFVFSGGDGGITNLYVADTSGHDLRRLTNDRFGNVQPQWSPDGKTIAFATDRGPSTDLSVMRFSWPQIALYDLASGTISVLPDQQGLNINPQWSPDGSTIAYVSDRTGTANIYLYDLATRHSRQLTDVIGAVTAITEYSPAISWARGSDRLLFTHFNDGKYTVWAIDHPRTLELNIASAQPTVPIAPPPAADSTQPTVSIAALMDSSTLGLPDSTRFTDHPYRAHFQPDYVVEPSIGYVPDNYGASIFGGTSVVLSDMLGDDRVAVSAELNGRLRETRLFLGYTALSHRWQYSIGLSQSPYYFLSSDSLVATSAPGTSLEKQEIETYVAHQAFAALDYPFTRFTRLEIGGGFNDVSREHTYITREVQESQIVSPFELDSITEGTSLQYVDAQIALVSDNTLFGATSAVSGQRYRLQVSPVAGDFKWVEYLLDYRRYDPVIFNELTFATRLYGDLSIGPDADAFPKYIARADFVRGYDRNNTFYLTCPVVGANTTNCSAVQLLGSRVTVANEELRFPLIRRLEVGGFSQSLPPVDGVLFYDAGLAWSAGQTIYGARPESFDVTRSRYPLTSYGFGVRMNLFGYAILRWDYAVPLNESHARGFWTWSLWPPY